MSAAAVNIGQDSAKTDDDIQNDVEDFSLPADPQQHQQQQREPKQLQGFPTAPQQSAFGSRPSFGPSSSRGLKKFGAPFENSQNSISNAFESLRPSSFENNLSPSGKLGAAFDDFGQVTQNNLEQFGKTSTSQVPGGQVSKSHFNLPSQNNVGSQFPFSPSFTSTNNNNLKQPTFGAPFGKSPQVIGPQNNPNFNTVDTDVEVFSKVKKHIK